MERPFCKYLCPLGAALAVPGTFRFFGLKRKSECTTCHACARGCTQLAIDGKGRIDQRECLLCLDCMVLYYDAHSCPPLAKERKHREKKGLPLTRINAGGYFEPITGAPAIAAALREAPRPVAVPTRFWDEVLFHVFPWTREFGREIFAIRAIAACLIVVVSTAWLLTAANRVGPAIMLAWWLGWSVYEILTRMRYKPLVKEGPWWRQGYRAASLADMIFYVGTKNLLIAAALFLSLHALGVLDILQQMPSLKWLYT
jgi:NosR/NirI family nitrous oxide reductase transcriptional regulator